MDLNKSFLSACIVGSRCWRQWRPRRRRRLCKAWTARQLSQKTTPRPEIASSNSSKDSHSSRSHGEQCDPIGRFIGLWATFQSLLQQLICPNTPHSLAIFGQVPKSLNFLVKSFLGNFYRYLATFYWSQWWWVPLKPEVKVMNELDDFLKVS